MSHPFGDLVSQHLHRKHGLSQSRLAAGTLQDPSIIAKMCKGQRLTGPQARERVLLIINWLRQQAVLETVTEANALLAAAGMSPLGEDAQPEEALLRQLHPQQQLDGERPGPSGNGLGRSPGKPARRTNLPAPLTSFVGRDRELADVTQQVLGHRLVTLTGVGGVGKTRLAIEAGIGLVRRSGANVFPDGILLVELAALFEPALVAQTIAGAFELPVLPDRPVLDLLQEHLADKHLLLVLDNCEHLADTCAEIAQHLLQHCWRLYILATSREALRLPGEHVYAVQPLALPDAEERSAEKVLASASAQLFMERVHCSGPTSRCGEEDAAAIARICRRLDGIPLALELAAALTRTMALREIADQLRDEMAVLRSSYRATVPRHQTMHSALLWSYRLLTPAEQRLLARVSVFAGGWTLAAAEVVCGSEPVTDVRAVLAQLVNKSLVLVEDGRGQPRYGLLEPLRQFAHEQLAASGEEAGVRRAHARYYLEQAEQLALEVDTAVERERLQRLESERDNLRAVNGWALEGREAEFALRFTWSLFNFWFLRSTCMEARHWLEAALALQATAPEPAPPALEARVVYAAAFAVVYQQSHVAQAYFERALALYTRLGDQVNIANATRSIGFAMMIRGDLAEAQEYSERGLALSRAAKDGKGIAWALHALGYIAYGRGDLDRAEVLLEEALSVLRAEGMTYGVCRALYYSGHVMRESGELARARALYEESLRMQQAVPYMEAIADVLEGVAAVAALEGHATRAARLFGAAVAHRDATGWTRLGPDEPSYRRNLKLARAHADPMAWQAAWDEGCNMTLEQAVEYALK